MRILTLFLFLAIAAGCTTHSKDPAGGDRKVAELDNDGVTLLDPSLEKLSSREEEEKSKRVAGVVGDFVARQSQLRRDNAKTPNESQETKNILSDLPTTNQEGQPLPSDIQTKYATRDVHRKTHGCYAGNLEISSHIQDDLNAQLIQFGKERASESFDAENPVPKIITSPQQLDVFRPGAHYEAIVRFSNGHPGHREDGAADARGMALKILPAGSMTKQVDKMASEVLNKATILDILTINFPTFFVNDPEKYVALNEKFLKGAEDFRNALSGQVLQGESIFLTGLTALERKLAFLSNGSIIYSPLFQNYWSMVPSRLGSFGEPRAVKYAFFPEACQGRQDAFKKELKIQWPEWADRRDFSLPTTTLLGGEKKIPPFKEKYPVNYLRTNAKKRLQREAMCFGLMFQLYRDQRSTNIEDSTDIWLSDIEAKNKWKKMVGSGLNLTISPTYFHGLDEKKYSPFIKVATLTLSKIDAQYPEYNTKTCEDLSFSPWNGNIASHKPLGVVSRMKRRVYNMSRHTRHNINGVPSQSLER